MHEPALHRRRSQWLALALLAASTAAVGSAAAPPSRPLSSAKAEALLHLAREPLSAGELRALGRTDDVLALTVLLPALRQRAERRASLGPIAPADLDREIIEALGGVERLDPLEAARCARELLEKVPPDASPAFAAGETLARGGAVDVVREALMHFFEAPERWGRVLGEAARATADPRLLDFLDLAGETPEPPTARLLQSKLETAFADSRDEWKLADILFWAEEKQTLTAARVLSSVPAGSVHEGWVRHVLVTLASARRGPSEDGPARRAARLRACAALGWRSATEAAPVLREALRDKDQEVAGTAALALARIGDRGALGLLREKALSSEEPLASAAVEALLQLGSEDEALRLAREKKSWSLQTALPVVRALAARGEDAAAALAGVFEAVARLEERLRLLRALAEDDVPVLKGIRMGPEAIGALSPYLARSRHREIRRLVLQAAGDDRGRALAALLLSPTASAAEKQEAAGALEGLWGQALCAGGPALVEELGRLPAPIDLATLLEVLPGADAPCVACVLAVVPGAAARKALERRPTAEAVERLMRRGDRTLSLPALLRWKHSDDEALREAAEIALVALGAPGSGVIMKQWVARPESERRLMPLLVQTPMASATLAFLARGSDRRPDVEAALFAFYRARPQDFLSLLSMQEPSARRRIHSAVALSEAPAALPLLVDVATNDHDKASRLAALRGLAEVELGPFRRWLHRAAGDRDRDIRFAAAVASVPSGELWALRLMLAEMDPARLEDRRVVRQALARLPAEKARELLGQVFRDGTGNAFSTVLYVCEVLDALTEDEQQRAWELASGELDTSPDALLLASRLDRRDAARAVLARLR